MRRHANAVEAKRFLYTSYVAGASPLFCRNVSVICCDRTLHEENESDERDSDYGKDKKCVEVRES